MGQRSCSSPQHGEVRAGFSCGRRARNLIRGDNRTVGGDRVWGWVTRDEEVPLEIFFYSIHVSHFY